MNQALRKSRLSLLAKAPEKDLADLWALGSLNPEFEFLRSPEQGAAMVQGRTGATGAPFNLGEMTITRCAIRLADGRVGHGYVQGRDKEKSIVVATIDALMLGEEVAQIEAEILLPLRKKMDAARKVKAAKAEATKVSFFTLARGED